MLETRRRSTSVETSGAREKQPVKIAYIMSRFPRITETFILYEILELAKCGMSVEIYPLLRTRETIRHPEAEKLVERAHYHPFLSLPILRAQWHFIRHRRLAYFKVLAEVLRGTFGNAKFFVTGVAIFPKAVWFAYEMERHGVTHIHAHFATHPTVAALIIHRLTGIPFSFTAHGSDLHVERRMLDKKVEAAAFAVTISTYNKELMMNESGEDARRKIHVIHCGVDPEVFSARPRSNEDGPFRILCVASFREVKGHKYLVEACEILHQRRVDFVCHLVGDGPLQRRIEAQIAKAGLQNNILLHGARPRSEIVKMLSEADAIVLASVLTRDGRREGIPVVLMEGMASGLPVVASRLSGIPELVDHGRSGLLVPPRNPYAIADALECLNENPALRHRMGMAGREKVEREFNLHISAAKRAELYVNGGTIQEGVAINLVPNS